MMPPRASPSESRDARALRRADAARTDVGATPSALPDHP
jgi:hypothetical protein